MSVGRHICKLYPFLFLSNKKFSWFMKLFPEITHFFAVIFMTSLKTLRISNVYTIILYKNILAFLCSIL